MRSQRGILGFVLAGVLVAGTATLSPATADSGVVPVERAAIGGPGHAETYPSGLEWPEQPQWGNFLQAFEDAHMGALLVSSVLIVLGVVPVAVVIATMAGFALGHLRIPGSRALFVLFLQLVEPGFI